MTHRLVSSFVAAGLALACVLACAQTPATPRTPPPIPPSSSGTRVIAPGLFERLDIDGAGQVTLVQSDRDEIVVQGDSDARAVSATLRGDRLSLSLPGGWKFWDSDRSQVEIHVQHLSRLSLSGMTNVAVPGPLETKQLRVSLSGAGLVRFDQLRVGALAIDIAGAGEAQLAGTADHLQLDLSGKGKVGAARLRAGDAKVSISGVGNAGVWVVENLDVEISGAGHVEYWGQPTLRQSISGIGSIDARGVR